MKGLRKILIPLIIVLSLVSMGAAGFFFWKYKSATKNNPAAEASSVIEKVGKLVLLPQGEEPTLATVSDRDKLLDQEFFSKAENGDKVLVYLKAGRAYLYRPSINKIIDIAPVKNVNSSPSAEPKEQSQSSETQSSTPTVTLYNGTSLVGITEDAQELIASEYPQYEILGRENANSRSYARTQIYDVSGKHKDAATKLATLFSGQVISSLPTGESEPESDLVVIVGRNFTASISTPTPAPTASNETNSESPDE